MRDIKEPMRSVERIEDISPDGGEGLIAIIIRNEYLPEGVTFFTDPDANQQVGFIKHPTNAVIERHRHIPYERKIYGTTEVLLIRKGEIRVSLYTSAQKFITNRELVKGDILILVSGGHEFKVIKDVEMIEVKQGPYTEQTDKIHF